MKRIRVGIPRALLYHRYGVMWKTFFTKLGCKVVMSPETNPEILTTGINHCYRELCLPYKIYIGHLLYLKDKCDFLLIARICDYGKNNYTCPIYEDIYSTIKYIIPQEEIIIYNIEHPKHKYEFCEFIKIGLKINKNLLKVIYCYLSAKKKQKDYDICKENENKNHLNCLKKKILIVSQSYIIYDKLIGNRIINYLENQNITLIYANQLDKSLAASFSDYFSENLSWKYHKELMGAIYYYRHQIDGIIFISSNNCQQEAIIYSLAILKNKYLPTLNIKIKEETTEDEIKGNLEKYINTLKGWYNE